MLPWFKTIFDVSGQFLVVLVQFARLLGLAVQAVVFETDFSVHRTREKVQLYSFLLQNKHMELLSKGLINSSSTNSRSSIHSNTFSCVIPNTTLNSGCHCNPIPLRYQIPFIIIIIIIIPKQENWVRVSEWRISSGDASITVEIHLYDPLQSVAAENVPHRNLFVCFTRTLQCRPA